MLAIVIPYHKLLFFEKTLRSLSNQTDKRFKVYIGDDASPENPYSLLQKYKDSVDFIYHRFEDNLGSISLTKHWGRCIDLINAEEWLMILGDDDVLGNNVVEVFYNNIKSINSKKISVIRYSSQIIEETDVNLSQVFKNPELEMAAKSFWRKHRGKTRSSLSEYVFKKDQYLKYNFRNYPLGWCSDDMAWLEFSNYNYIYSINKAIIFIRETSSSISGKKDNLRLKKEAELSFFLDIVKNKLSMFKRENQIELLMSTELLLKRKIKLTNKEWGYFARGYLATFSLIANLKFIRRYFKRNS